jgi:hypothetical protein
MRDFPYFMKTELAFMPFSHSFASTYVYMQWDSVSTFAAFLQSHRMLETRPFIRYTFVLLLANTSMPYNGVREYRSLQLHISVLRIAHLRLKWVWTLYKIGSQKPLQSSQSGCIKRRSVNIVWRNNGCLLWQSYGINTLWAESEFLDHQVVACMVTTRLYKVNF